MNQAKLKRLLHQYFNNTISSADCIELLDYLKNADTDEIDKLITEDYFDLDEGPEFSEAQSQNILNRIKADSRFITSIDGSGHTQPKVRRLYRTPWLQIAATLLLLCTVTWLLFKHKANKSSVSKLYTSHPAVSPIIPGSNKATLITDDGRVILLDKASNGVLAKNNRYSVLKTHNGQITYRSKGHSSAALGNIGYNTLTTPKGGEYQVVLPDGTKVWLNAGSSICYPTAFAGNERRVTLAGEAYFEVAKNARKPFYVNTGTMQVRVLGTHFNISAYHDDDAITTTLLEGAVQITKNKSLSLLKPGQQAVVGYKSDQIAVSQGNINEAVAWKNGYFIFDEDNISSIMKKVSRWYDVDVQYQSSSNNQKFGGTFHRSKSITELLHYLEKIGDIKFKISERRIIVMN